MSDHHQKPMSASPTSCFPWVRGQIAEYLINMLNHNSAEQNFKTPEFFNKILSEFNFVVKKKTVFENLKSILFKIYTDIWMQFLVSCLNSITCFTNAFQDKLHYYIMDRTCIYKWNKFWNANMYPDKSSKVDLTFWLMGGKKSQADIDQNCD